MYNDSRSNVLQVFLLGVAGIVVIFLLGWAIASMPHHVHKHVKIERLKTGKYVFEDTMNDVDTWWYFDSGSSTSSVVKNANGTLTFPRGGSWTKGEKPEPEEIEEIDEANISEDEAGDVDADSTADSSSGTDGAGDSGSDSGDGGDGDGGSD